MSCNLNGLFGYIIKLTASCLIYSFRFLSPKEVPNIDLSILPCVVFSLLLRSMPVPRTLHREIRTDQPCSEVLRNLRFSSTCAKRTQFWFISISIFFLRFPVTHSCPMYTYSSSFCIFLPIILFVCVVVPLVSCCLNLLFLRPAASPCHLHISCSGQLWRSAD